MTQNPLVLAALVANYSDSSGEEEEEVERQQGPSFSEIGTESDARNELNDTDRLPHDVNNDTCEIKQSTETECNNFFGIESDSDSDDSSSESLHSTVAHVRQLAKAQKINRKTPIADSSADKVVVPNSAFWKKNDKLQNWDQPEKIWKQTSDVIAKSVNRPKRHVDNSQEQQITSYIKRNRSDNGQGQGNDTNDQSSPLTRKCYFVHHRVQPHLHRPSACTVPPSHSKTLRGHSGAVNRIRWNYGEFSHLLLSVSMDRTVKIWNAFSNDTNQVQEFHQHGKAVKDGLWVNQGRQVITCGYDNSARLFDVEKGSELLEFSHRDLLSCIESHPTNPNYFMCGSLNRIICWDQRSNSRPVRTFAYKEPFGQVQSLQFVNYGQEFFICNDLVSRDSSDKNVMVWDFVAGVVLSNQVYHERFTCTRLKANPTGGDVLAQTNGDYIALFSTVRPYKMNKCKRFESHKVQGFNIGCDISPDGQYVISGSSDNQLFVYDYRTSRILRTLKCDNQVCMDVAWHPQLPNTVAGSTWGGDVKVWS